MARMSRRRATLLLAGTLVAIAGLGVRLAYVQGVNADRYADIARRQRVRSIVLPAMRGAIYDRNGREIALSLPARTVYANPKQISDRRGTARVLSPLLGISVDQLVRQLDKPKGFVYLARRIDVQLADRIEKLRLIGVGTLNESRRDYPSGPLASNVVGFVGTDASGLGGLEHAFESLLGGRPGLRVLEQDALGRPIPQGHYSEKPPVAGSDLVLTLDRDIQFAADAALARAIDDTHAKGGSVVVMRPDTGEILAMANQPTYDPNDISRVSLDEVRNRAITDSYEPGSANKVVTAAAAIEEGIVNPNTSFAVPAVITVAGRQFHDAHGHAAKSMRFEDIIAQSSNVGTIKVALQLGPQRLYEYLRRFGYGRATGLGFPGEASGMLPRADRWKTSLPTMAIGQGLSVTALQIARVYATVANDGVAVEPHLVSGWVDASGDLHRAPRSRTARVVSATTAATLRSILTKVVTDGTGTLAQVPGYVTAGKTGTAQKPGPHGGYQGYMASFMGMVPADDPQLVIGIVLDDPSPIWGGVVAAPVFRDVAQAALRIMRVPPTQIAPTLADDAARASRASGALLDNDAATASPGGRGGLGGRESPSTTGPFGPNQQTKATPAPNQKPKATPKPNSSPRATVSKR
jgi:cell division protein FtsI (penicillin-binding protein 3)